MKEVVALKIKIGLRENGQADHPDWDSLPITGAAKDHQFGSWKYDKSSGHKEDTPGSPYGMQWGMMMVSPTLAKAALKAWPNKTSIMKPSEVPAFWEKCHTAHMREVDLDGNILTALNAELDLRTKMRLPLTKVKEDIKKALDKDHTAPGVRRSKYKEFAEFKKGMPAFKILTERALDAFGAG
jgi:hypothetical protein